MSVRGERVVYKEREVDYEEAPRRTYTTVKRYQVPESISRSLDDVKDEKKIVIRRERRESPRRDEGEWRVTERIRTEREPTREEEDYRITERLRELEREPRRDISYRVVERSSDHDRYSQAPRSVRGPSPHSPERVREFRFERERDFEPPRRREQPYDIERYSKSTEYFAQPQPIIIREPAPQPIIIREERAAPVIIREERREPQYEFIERSEVKEDNRSALVKREEPPPPAPVSVAPPQPSPSAHPEPEEENYFYERRVIERDRGPRRRDESHDRRTEIRPRDSASQYSSDDSYEYVRKERTYEGSRERDRSPHHRRHLAEGALAGAAAGAILRHHRKEQGKETHRGRSVLGGAALGAAGAELVSRARSMRRGSRSRSRSSSYEGRRDRRDDRRGKKKERSRSKSLSRAQTLGGIAAVAAVGALAGYALNKRNQQKNETVIVTDSPRRSRSRRRRASVDSYYTDDRTVLSDGGGRALDPNHRNRRIAQAGLASAAAAGIWDRVRSKSRGGRSKSRIRQGVPIAAAGLGGAALAGLYEKNKANKEAQKAAVLEDERHRGRRRHSRSRSRSVPARYPEDDRRVDDQGLIAYGNEPIYPEAGRGYYSDEEPGMYRRRHRGGSDSGSSPDTRRRSGSRGRHLAEAGAAAGVAAVAAHEIGRRRERSRQRADVDRRPGRDEEGYDAYRYDQDYPYSPQQQDGGYLPQQQQNAGYNNQQGYQGGPYFPPPPTGEYAREQQLPAAENANPYPPYNPAEYAQGAQQQQPHHQPYGPYGDSEANLGAPYPNDTFAGDQRYPEPQHDDRRGGNNPENVSAPNASSAERASQDAGTSFVPAHEPQKVEEIIANVMSADGISTPRAPRSRSQSRVRFNLDANTAHSPETARKTNREERFSDNEMSDDRKHRRRGRRGREREGEGSTRSSPSLMHDKYEREPDEESDGTVELPERFDEHGNRKDGGDALASTIQGFLGNPAITDFLARLTGEDGNDDGGRSGRRRSRR